MKNPSTLTNDPEGPRIGSEIEDSYDGRDLTHEDRDVDDSEDGYRPFFWYNRDYNIPDECRFYQ